MDTGTAIETTNWHALGGALDPVPVGVILFDPHGRPRVANRLARDILGEVAGLPLDRWIEVGGFLAADGTPLEAAELPPLATLQDGAPRREVELQIVRGGAAPRPLLVSSRAVHDPAGAVLQVAFTVTPFGDQCRRRARELLAGRLEALGALTSGVAGPLNDALTAITGYCDLAETRLAPGDPVQGVIEEIRQAGERATVLAGRLLTHGGRELSVPQPLEVDRWLATRVTSLKGLLGAEIVLDVSPDADGAWIEADPRLLEQMLAEVLANARDAMPDGGRVRLATRTAHAGHDEAWLEDGGDDHPQVVLSVTDTGLGVPDAVLRRMFEPFFTTKPGALGLGLATVDRLARSQAGRVRVENHRGEGVTVHLQLPQAVLSEQAKGRSASGRAPLRLDTKAPRVLVVEDDSVVRELVVQVLELEHHRVLEARSAADADHVLTAHRDEGPPDLLVCDLVMPGEAGIDLAARLRKAWPSLCVLYMSGASNPCALDDVLANGQADFLAKPFAPAALVNHVRTLLAGRDADADADAPPAPVTLRPSA